MSHGRRALPLATVALVAGLALSGCSSAPQGTPIPAAADGTYVVPMMPDLTFQPAEARVPVGAHVVFRNASTFTHDVAVYLGDPIASDEPVTTSAQQYGIGGAIPANATFAHTFATAGTYTIWCHTHHEAGMKQVLHVG